MVHRSAGEADQAAYRGAVDDGAASLLAHPAQLVLHAVPDAAEIDRIHAIKFFAAGIRGFHGGRLHAGVVVRRIQATEGGYGLLDHGSHLSLVGDIATYANRLMAGGSQFLCCRASRVLMDVRQRDGSPRLREGFGCHQTDAGGGTGNKCDFIVERPVHDRSPLDRIFRCTPIRDHSSWRVGRKRISFTSTSSGWLIAKATARANESAGIAISA